MAYSSHSVNQLPHPDYDAELYADVLSKRFLAWVIDNVLISIIVAFVVTMSLFVALFFLPFLYFGVSFTYRWLSLASSSATPGMMVMAIQLRDHTGQSLDNSAAFFHTAGYSISMIALPLQLISVAMMLTTPRKQGLTDAILGTVAINRPIR